MASYNLADNCRNGQSPPEGFAESAFYEILANKTLEELMSRNDGMSIFPNNAEVPNFSDEKIIWGWQDSIKTGNIMGFLGYEGDTLIIHSRFANKTSNDEESGELNDWFLFHMLGRVLKYHPVDLKLGQSDDESYLSLLELLFPECLASALKLGIYKTYVRREFNDAHVRGAIDVPRFIKEDVPFMGKVAYNTREYSYDNYVMQLVRHAVEAILSEHGNNLVRRCVREMLSNDSDYRDCVRKVRDATPTYRKHDRQKVVQANLKRPVRNRYFHSYRKLQQLSLEILLGRKVSFENSSDDKVHGILFDGSALWEEYVYWILREYGDFGEDLLHPHNREPTLTQHYFQHRTGEIYPDFIVDAEACIVMDAKYKYADSAYKPNDDYHQLLGYMYRFESRQGFLLYPSSKKYVGSRSLRLLRGVSRNGTTKELGLQQPEITLTKVVLEIPEGYDSFDSFEEDMDRREEDFMRKIKRRIESTE